MQRAPSNTVDRYGRPLAQGHRMATDMPLGNLAAKHGGCDFGLLREYDVQFLELAERLLRRGGQEHDIQPVPE
jgi:hypothetical protein